MKEAMSPEERIKAVVALQEPDRVPIALYMDAFAARHAGITLAEWVFDYEKGEAAVEKTFADLGGFDAMIRTGAPHPDAYALGAAIPTKLPGRELPPDALWQYEESPLMTVEDYDTIIEKGLGAFWLSYWPRMGIDPAQVPAIMKIVAENAKKGIGRWQGRGVQIFRGGMILLPFDLFSFARSINEFIFDLYRRPEKVLQAAQAALPDIVDAAKRTAWNAGLPRVFLGATRAACTFVSPKQFETFFLPSLRWTVDNLVADGILPFLHFDNDWTAFLPYLKELPRARCILHLDGFTDIFQAKKVLEDHICLMGDVPPALLSLGTREQVAEYCRRLIDRVGAGGGFILAQGCTVPADAKFENVLAMVETAKTYGHYN